MMPHKSTVYEYEYEYETNLSHPIMSKVWKKFDANKKCWKTKKRSKECAFNSNRHIQRSKEWQGGVRSVFISFLPKRQNFQNRRRQNVCK